MATGLHLKGSMICRVQLEQFIGFAGGLRSNRVSTRRAVYLAPEQPRAGHQTNFGQGVVSRTPSRWDFLSRKYQPKVPTLEFVLVQVVVHN